MQALEILFVSLVAVGFWLVVIGYLLIQRLRADVREKVRVIFPGGTEREYSAQMVAKKLVFTQGDEEREVEVTMGDTPDRGLRWGLPHHFYYNEDGKSATTIPAWRGIQDPYQIVAATEEDAKGVHQQVEQIWDDKERDAKNRHDRRINALAAFKQLVSGLTGMNKYQALALLMLGFFMGTTVATMIFLGGMGG